MRATTFASLSFKSARLCVDLLHSLLAADRATLEPVGTLVVPKYLTLVRKLQIRYGLEPAGSHGMWSIDDYHLLPFVLGGFWV